MKKIFSKRSLMGMVAFFGCIAIAVTAMAIPAFGDSTRTVTVDTDTVLSENYHGLGDNLWIGQYAYGMNDAYQTVSDQRTNTIKPAYMRMMFLPNWLVDASLSVEEQEYNWTHGIYTFDSLEFKSFVRNAQTIYNAGGKILLNMGGRITLEMTEWYAIKSVSLSEGGTRSAPKDIPAFARATVAVINELKNNGVNVDYLCFHNEVNGGNFEAFFDKRAYWAEVIKQTSIELDNAGLRSIEKNKAGTRDGIYVFATELAGWANEQPVLDYIDFCGKHLIEKGYADGISNHQYQHDKDSDTVVKLSNKLSEIFPDYDLFINEFNGQNMPVLDKTISGDGQYSHFAFNNNGFSNIIAQINAGYSGAASWFYYGTLISHPMNVAQSAIDICYWECPSEGLERVSYTMDEKALAARYIPKNSKSFKTTTDSDDILAAALGKDGDYTVLVEFDKCDTDRNLKVKLGTAAAGKKFGVHITYMPDDLNGDGVYAEENLPRADGDLLPVRIDTVTVDSNGDLNWTIPASKVHGNLVLTTLPEQVQVVLEDAELSVAPGGSVDIAVKDVFGTECGDYNFEIYDFSGADEEEDYAFASKQTLASIGVLEQNASGIATFTAASDLSVGDTIAIKVTPNVNMSADVSGYAIAIIRVGEYRVYLNHVYADPQGEYCSFLYEFGAEEDIDAPKLDVLGVNDKYIIAKNELTFKGWYLTPDFSGEQVTKTDPAWNSTIHLYGKWDK